MPDLISEYRQAKLLKLIEAARRATAAYANWPDDAPEGSTVEEVAAHEAASFRLCDAEFAALNEIFEAVALGPDRRPRAYLLNDGAILCVTDDGAVIVEPDRVERIGGAK